MKKIQGKTVKFMEKRGFYIILFLCIVIVGITAMLVTRSNMEYFSNSWLDEEELVMKEDTVDNQAEKAEQENSNGASAVNQKPIIVQKSVEEVKNEKAVAQTTDKVQNSVPAIQSNHSQKPAAISKFMFPVQGDIMVEYAKDHIIYSKTLGDWRTHKGIDIKSILGAQVKAAADGVIEKIYNDDGYGITIIIDHRNGIKTKYCNLSTDSMVKEGQNVKQGDIISGIGDTAVFEIGEEPHLHFEVIKDGESVDPKTFLAY